MFATMTAAPSEGYLVIREQRAALPEMNPMDRNGAAQLALLAQMEGESYQGFAARVLGRVTRDLQQGQGLGGVLLSIEPSVSAMASMSRATLVRRLAELLANRPNSELVIQASSNCGPVERLGLFELVDSVMRAVPMLKVRLTFADPLKKTGSRRRVAGRSSPSAAA